PYASGPQTELSPDFICDVAGSMRESARKLAAQTAPPPAASQPAPRSGTKALDSPAFGSVQLFSIRSVSGSTRMTRPSLVPTQSDPNAATSERGVPPTENVDATRRVRASILEIVPIPSFEFTTQIQRGDAAVAVGAFPTGTAATASSERGSTSASEFGRTSTAPSPAVRTSAITTAAMASSAAPDANSNRPARRRRRRTTIGEGASPTAARASSTNAMQLS